ncbi:hypothetical protein Droror1_Dr00015653 [Drosera rotundifolia]
MRLVLATKERAVIRPRNIKLVVIIVQSPSTDLDGIEWESGSSPASSSPGRDSPSTWMREIECMLMNDDGIEAVMEGDGEICGDFLDALCHDDDHVRGQSSPEIVDRGDVVDRGEVVDRVVVDQGDLIDIGELFDEGELIDLSNSTSSSNEKIDVVQDQLVSDTSGDDVAVRLENVSDGAVVGGEVNDDNPSSKKRRRQLRNRDAAVKSRERKKMYVKDLEMKSRYLEAECRRLGRLLQCSYAENQVLRFSLHGGKAYGAPLTKQESAVLLLESLLLGSLLWFLGIMCLLPFPSLAQLTLNQGAARLENAGNKRRGSVALNGAGSELTNSRMPPCPLKSKRCKASRTKIKSVSLLERSWFIKCYSAISVVS